MDGQHLHQYQQNELRITSDLHSLNTKKTTAYEVDLVRSLKELGHLLFVSLHFIIATPCLSLKI